MARFNHEVFELIERRGSITVDEMTEKFGISKRSAATYLSKYTNYHNRQRGIMQHFLAHVPGGHGHPGKYIIGPDWWGELHFQTAKMPYEVYHNKGGKNERT